MKNEFAGYPEQFNPSPPECGILKAAAWSLTFLGRTRLKMRRLCRNPEDAKTRMALQSCLKQLDKLISRRNLQAEQSKGEALLLLAWAGIKTDSYDLAQKSLTILDLNYGKRVERIGLRWQLMTKLQKVQALHNDYVSQAFLLIKDPIIHPQTYRQAILETIDAVYRLTSPKKCGELLNAANTDLLRLKELKAAATLCSSYQETSSKEFSKLASRIEVSDLDFSLLMKADAFLQKARDCELANNFTEMVKHSKEALCTIKDYAPARYWRTRALMHANISLEDPGKPPSPNSPEWTRLLCEVELYRNPVFEPAVVVTGLLKNEQKLMDAKEKELCIHLLGKALRWEAGWTLDQLTRGAQICLEVIRYAGKVPWAEFSIALYEILVAGEFSAAAARLDSPGMESQDDIQWLRIARVLAGTPRPPKLDEATPIANIERSMLWLFESGRKEETALLLENLLSTRSDPICRQVPMLASIVELLAACVSFVADTAENVSLIPLPPKAPLWAIWTHRRLTLMLEGTSIEQRKDGPAAAPAWSEALYRCLYSQSAPEIGEYIPQDSIRIEELGECLCFSSLKLEQTVASSYSKARKALSRFHQSRLTIEDVRKSWMSVCSTDLPPFLQKLWMPALKYWEGAILVHTDRDGAKAVWEGIRRGPKAIEAKAQLALLAICDGKISDARKLLDEVPIDFPGGIYSHALCLEREGSFDNAQSLLMAYEHRFGGVNSSYTSAARRLRAAIAERRGNQTEAERICREALEASPQDPILSGRLARILLEKNYFGWAGGRPFHPGGIDQHLHHAGLSNRPLQWLLSYQTIFDLLRAGPGDIAKLVMGAVQPGANSESMPLLQVAVRRLVEDRRPGAAYGLMQSYQPKNAQLQCTRLILSSWHLLSQLWKLPQMPDQAAIQAEVERLRASGEDREDLWDFSERNLRRKAIDESVSTTVLEEIHSCSEQMMKAGWIETNGEGSRWCNLLRRAIQLSKAGSEPWEAPWVEPADWPFANVLALWSPQSEVRLAASKAVEDALQHSGLNWNESQQALLQALSAWIQDHEDKYLDCYQLLESKLSQLPVDGADLWFGAAQIWFRHKQWKRLLESDLPECVAGLSQPHVKLIIGLAYARAAAGLAGKDDPEALRKVKQARSTLSQFSEMN